MANTLYNPSAGNVFFNTSGSAAVSAIDVKSGAMINAGSTTTAVKNVALGTPMEPQANNTIDRNFGNGVAQAILTAKVSCEAVAISGDGGYCSFNKTSHGLSVGNRILVAGATNRKFNAVHEVTDAAAPGANNFTTDVPFVEDITEASTAVTYQPLTAGYTVGKVNAGKYVIRNAGANAEYIANVANTAMRCPGNAGTVQNPSRAADRGEQTATAIRANRWNKQTGKWVTAFPSGETASFWSNAGNQTTPDDVARPTASKPGELVYMHGAPNPKQDDYKASTSR